MSFFRLRLINTIFLFCAGLALGYMIRGSRGGEAPRHSPERHRAASPAPEAGLPEPAAPEAEIKTELLPGPRSSAPRPAGRTGAAEDFEFPVGEAEEKSYDESVYADEPALTRDGRGGRKKGPSEDALRGAEDEFFRAPARFSGRDLEMELQMIMAKRHPKGWLLNLVRSKNGKSADYLYLEDDFVLGEKPDLRIGYFYRVRFRCNKGDTASGNRLLELGDTGEKAAWATGVSAVE